MTSASPEALMRMLSSLPIVALALFAMSSCEEVKPGDVCLSKVSGISRSTCAGSKCLNVEQALVFPKPAFPVTCIHCVPADSDGSSNGLYALSQEPGAARWDLRIEGEFAGVRARAEDVLAVDFKGSLVVDEQESDSSGVGLYTVYAFGPADVASLKFSGGRIQLVTDASVVTVTQLLRPAAPECLPYVVDSCTCTWGNAPSTAEKRRLELDLPYDAASFAP